MNSTVVIKSWHEIGLNVNPNAVNVKTTCPACSETRKNKRDKCLSVSPAKGVANCHNCQTTYLIEQKPHKEYKKPEIKQSPLSTRLIKFFKDRHIDESTLEYFKVTESREWMYSRGDESEGETVCINFNYYQNQELVNVKFRASGKRFRMVSGAKLIFYNLDAIKDSDWCAIQEGEIDSMAAYQSGVYKSISVPNGASMGNLVLEYLDNCIDHFKGKKKIIIATDNDEPGRALGEELIRRLGRARCYTIEYPEGCKDTNDVLIKHGSKAVKAMYDNASPLPLEGVFTAEQLNEGIMDFYRNGFPKGLRLGYKQFDQLLTFRGGELTVVTGIPGSGKSEFVDQVAVRLAARYEWRCGVFSPENQPSSLHAMSLLSKFLGGKTIGKDKVSEMKIQKGSEFINDHFFFMKVDEIDVTIDGILDLAEELVMKKGIKALVIDPYNYIEHRIPHGQTETQYISELLTKLCNFCRRNDVHGFLIAHPIKIKKDKNTGKYEVATLYDIAGSAHFFNKTYNGISVYRDFETNEVTVYIPKVKYKFIGKIGNCVFKYDKDTGRYSDDLGGEFENEFDKLMAKESQAQIFFEPEPALQRESGQLTDISKLPVSSGFDFTERENAPF